MRPVSSSSAALAADGERRAGSGERGAGESAESSVTPDLERARKAFFGRGLKTGRADSETTDGRPDFAAAFGFSSVGGRARA